MYHYQINGIYLLKHAEVPGALVEIGFLSNEEERELLKDSKNIKNKWRVVYIMESFVM